MLTLRKLQIDLNTPRLHEKNISLNSSSIYGEETVYAEVNNGFRRTPALFLFYYGPTHAKAVLPWTER